MAQYKVGDRVEGYDFGKGTVIAVSTSAMSGKTSVRVEFDGVEGKSKYGDIHDGKRSAWVSPKSITPVIEPTPGKRWVLNKPRQMGKSAFYEQFNDVANSFYKEWNDKIIASDYGWTGANSITTYTVDEAQEIDLPSFRSVYDVFADHNVNKETKKMSSTKKYYRTLQDLPTIEQGAILEEYGSSYRLTNDLYEKDNVPEDETVLINNWNVEGSPTFYERVYKIPGTETFGSKEQARAALDASTRAQEVPQA